MLTVLGLSSIQTTTIEERMAGNMRDSNIAFQSAEAAVRDAEILIEGSVAISAFNDANGLFNSNDTDGTPAPDYKAAATWSSNATSRAATSKIPSAASTPRYFIQHIGKAGEDDECKNRGNLTLDDSCAGGGLSDTFRITVRGTGGTNNAIVVIRTYYGKRY